MSIEHSTKLGVIDTCYTEYLRLPKDFGAISSQELFEFADLNAKSAEAVPAGASTQFHAVAGSAYIEAVLTAGLSEDEVDQRLEYLASAEYHLRAAADLEYQYIESGMRHPDDQDDWQRAELQYDFMNVYRDITCGEVTRQTRNEILERLQYRMGYNTHFTKHNWKWAGGLLGELQALQGIWRAHRDPLDKIAFPSTVRGGSGKVRPEETHDIVIATTPDGQQRWYSGAEVKSGLGLQGKDLVRYTRAVYHMGKQGVIQVYDAI